MTLVKVHCKTCGKLLGWFDWAPAEGDELGWSGLVWTPLCPQHGGARGSVASWIEKRRRAGLPHDRYPVGRYRPWAIFRADVQTARRLGRTQQHRL